MTPRRSSEPACRVCGCTEYAACDDGCSWVKVEKNSQPLCSACVGKIGDVLEVCGRIRSLFRRLGFGADTARHADAIMIALKARVKVRIAADAVNPDPAWGNR